MMTGFTQDFRYALRQLAQSAGLCRGCDRHACAWHRREHRDLQPARPGAACELFPVKDADRLVILQSLGSFNGHTSSRTDENFSFSYPMYRDLRDRNSVFSGLIATDKVSVGVQWHNQPELVDGELVSGNYFDVLGVQPALGRLLVASDDVVPTRIR